MLSASDVFRRQVQEPFLMFNTLFLSLPFRDIQRTGERIPLLTHACERGLEEGLSPEAVMDLFFRDTLGIEDEGEQVDFMFRVIQYVERQVVLFDSVEEAAGPRVPRAESPLLRLISEDRDGAFRSRLDTFRARVVFTAHPT
ncbi:MAG: phosphoenolpyruvate carboxylase, partial [Bacteroidetes bacterium]|nr:phosphoenolpyruvate carboxylase [Bacteroidota bacterium]